jgi:hypothetical protein
MIISVPVSMDGDDQYKYSFKDDPTEARVKSQLEQDAKMPLMWNSGVEVATAQQPPTRFWLYGKAVEQSLSEK